MIPGDFISEWKKAAPWSRNDQVEQDLIISRALVEIFNHPYLADNLAFRGGTALFKLHLPPVRYSEDIDLVQVHPGPIGPVMSALQEKLNPWLGSPKRKQGEGRVTLTYRVASEEGAPLKLKVEINSREHFTFFGYERRALAVDSRWFSGSASILTYQLDELLGTKVRALYQRKKGRDLFDLWIAFTSANARSERVIDCFLRYMENEGHRVSRAEFERNLLAKLNDRKFIAEIEPLLVADSGFDLPKAAELMIERLAPLIPGQPWQGKTAT
ncbi:MAG: nucleotidyl transferase AbiEii/AbiGii toxin family protein [Deltaproteobacteria bacterium]|nr:nucleotidyl transferase AbiEii/AbiGii toxin family protein [Deltaproteobacteria bacterium]